MVSYFQEADPHEYDLIETILEHEIRERVMSREECPWPQLIKARQVVSHCMFVAKCAAI